MSFNFVIPEFNIGGNGTPTLEFFRKGFRLGSGKVTPDYRDIILHGNTALTLVNAKANGLEYLKLFGDTEQLSETYLDTVTLSGGCEQRNLPSGHQQLNYLQGDGTAYIEADVVPTNNTGMKIVFEYGELGDSAATSGVFDGVIPRQDTFFVSTNSGSVSSNTTIFIAHRGDTLSQSSLEAETPVVGKTYTALINYMNDGYIGFEGFSQKQLTTLSDVLPNKVLLFARLNYNNDNITASSDKIKYVEFTEGTEVIRKYYPDRYNNVLGLYDTITNTFLTNKNSSGTFAAGADVVPSPDEPINIVCNNGVIKYGANGESLISNIPDGQGTFVTPIASTTNRVYKNFGQLNGKYFVEISDGYEFIVQYKDTPFGSNATDWGNIDSWAASGTYTFDSTGTGYYYGMAIRKTDNNNITPTSFNGTMSLRVVSIYTDGTQEVVTDSVGNTASAEMLLGISSERDTQEVISGGITHHIGIKVLDGSENWSSVTNADITYYTADILDDNMFSHLICTHFTNQAPMLANNSVYKSAGDSVLQIRYDGVNSLADFKTWLASQYSNGSPVIVLYGLQTATTSTVSGQFLSKSPVTQTAGSISNLPIAITESSHTVPTPQQPLQINCNNGVVKVSKNLFNYVNFYANYVTITESAVGRLAIQLKPNTQYVLSTNTQISQTSAQIWVVSGNDINFTPNTSVNGVLINTPRTVISDNNGYICLGIRTAASGSITPLTEQDFINGTVWLQIEEGSVATPYMPYGQIYTDGTTETVEITGKNLFDKSAITQGYIYNAQLEYVTSDIASLSDYIPVVAGQPYTFTGYKEITGNFNIRINYFDTDKEIQSQDVKAVGLGNYSFTITIPSGIKYLRYSFRTEMADSQQLELGSTATTYENYFNGGSATAENLFKVGTYQDVQSVIDGGVTRNVGVHIITGQESSFEYSNGRFSFILSDNFVLPNTCICTHYQGVSSDLSVAQMNDLQIKCGYIGFANKVYIKDSRFNTASDLQTWLADQYNAGTPVIVVYPLATATTETVTAQPMNIQAGTNNVTITQASMDDLELEVKYKAGVAVTITEIENAQLDDNVEVTING